MPESPYYLVMKSRIAEAEISLQKLRRKKNVDKELKMLISDVNRQISEPGRYKDLFIINSAAYQHFHCTCRCFLKKSTNVLPKDIASTLIFGLQFISNAMAAFVVDKTGRKPLLTLSCLGCCFMLIFEGVYFTIQDYTDIDVSNLDYLPLIGIVIFTIAFAIGQGNVINLMIGEMFSSSIKAKASCIMNIIFAVTMTMSTKFFQYTSDSISLCVPFYVFGACQLLGGAFCILYVPETKGKTLEDIQQELKGRCKTIRAGHN
ncbi:hypothetical protein NQ314_011116 [Rhamnusium bicolor]|uniref:Major facilitator superfamily (MFS) profile domain-containing protein n=1 Tax=Rhamnusium bicolor TaxID=1586634 RepID=A0AAV8XKC8_9CUCU|nr:hypothetical protein NQ314_011116 [Rhamnusium bicolor]